MEVTYTASAPELQAPLAGDSSTVRESVASYPDPNGVLVHSASSVDVAAQPEPSHGESILNPLPTPREEEHVETPDYMAGYIPVGILKIQSTQDHGSDRSQYPAAEVTRLKAADWIRCAKLENMSYPEWASLRIFVLPDDVQRGSVPRESAALRKALQRVMSKIDSSRESWEGHFVPGAPTTASPIEEQESLFYIFNTLDSPSPDLGRVSDPYSKNAMQEILLSSGQGDLDMDANDGGIIGLKTSLYSYQSRSAAYMVERETEPRQMLDPRLQRHVGPTGQEYYYDKEQGSIVFEKRLYSEPCGGILAETMGYGKTLICLAVILATKGHFPRIPSAYIADTRPVRTQTASLLDMAAAAAGRLSLPWVDHFDNLERKGIYYEKCRTACEKNRGSYTIPPPVQKYQSRAGASSRIKPRHLLLSSGTLIVVPMNLIDHWTHEIRKHTHGLKILVLRDTKDETPSPEELLKFDIIIFAKKRFDFEAKGCDLDQFIRGKEKRVSPLTKIHWLRIVVDEGHNFAGHGQKTSSVHMLELLHVDRRWVVSGTPSSGLYGAEISLASQETEGDIQSTPKTSTDLIESRRKVGTLLDEELKDLDKLRLTVVEFLNSKPWSNSRSDDPADWGTYMKPLGPDGRRRKAPYLRSTLQSLVVRHRLSDIDNDITLPKLHNKVVYLNPTSFDRMSINLFIFILTVNAITSERTGEDYMFHSKNRKHLSTLIGNLRHAGFWWTGFGEHDITSAVHHGKEYLEKNRDRMLPLDREVLCNGIAIAENAINSSCWNVFHQFHELGVFVDFFPEEARPFWALDSEGSEQGPLLMGISQAKKAQKFITSRLSCDDPAEGMAGAGIKTRRDMKKTEDGQTSAPRGPRGRVNVGAKKPVTESLSPKKSSAKKSFSKGYSKSLSLESPLAKTKFVATASAKLTYLLQQVLEFHGEEKIIIFYENDNFAYWIAEGLELLNIEFRIYAKSLSRNQMSEYLFDFNEGEKIRVLLMDLRQAAHGLHIACASRVFIVNPIWRPTIESQAIKRAHRISQKRPVFVETLVLQGTFEDKLLRRRKQMTNAELQHAEKDLLDDSTMDFIVKNMGFLKGPMGENLQPAYLKGPPGFFDRHTLKLPDDYEETSKAKQVPFPSKAVKRKAVRMLDTPLEPSHFNGSTSSSVEEGPDKKRVKLPGPIESHILHTSSGNNAFLTPPESASTQILSPGLSNGTGPSAQ